MDLYTLILVGDERSPVKRFQVPKITAHRAAAIAGVFACLLAIGVWDYWRVRAENGELPELRSETEAQAAKIRAFERELATVEAELTRVQELERKVRIIANLPGAAATGGSPSQTRIVIVDDNQLISQIIREYTSSGKWELLRDQEPSSGVPAAILVMGDPKELTEQLCPSHLVHLREKASE